MIRTLIVCAAFGATAATAQDAVRYEFDLELISNNHDSLGIGGVLAGIPIGATGRVSYFIDTDTDAFPGSGGVDTHYFRTLDTSLIVDGIDFPAAAGEYPSTSSFYSFKVTDNYETSSGGYQDQLFQFTSHDYDETESIAALFLLADDGTASAEPDLLTSTDLPLGLDVSSATSRIFDVGSSLDTRSSLRFEVTDVTITLIPAPSALGVLGLGGLAMVRRRR